ncbi:MULTISPECIES: SUMF1/EgtB/PvdO family nonheme iron enzyme [Nostoc]|uniref:SUMF1/EgtB/PvdO family nonheme iron enzyme n=2 Tax=Nostoc TaxID=1177 RepID=A0ABR8ID57_9NOSO|nr:MULTISPECIES: SUMF1/EgtB/PvdO family nonheme iron enzyme [Nostoc]MBD2563199.1 SUMF1/EgtB/PvdO family nonheme iron enzyme [Nostoc linckia FACHB-391]MBD2648867.1 SUMF1/EgtB/PvdO family nonheme iron enzyme [Nostoc foliaceum FACHB-393]
MADVSLEPLKVFCSYSHNDEPLKDELAKHLTMLERQGITSTWHDRKIPPGKEWDQQINENLNTADIILLLVSSDFIFSKYCWDVEVTKAIERHANGEACVIPIILRNVFWQDAPFAKLQALPKNAQPIKSWSNQDDAFTNVAQGIKFAAEQLIKEREQQRVRKEAAIAEYLQKAEEFASDGEISSVESYILEDLQEKLKLTDKEDIASREKALEPYGIYKKNLDKYKQYLTRVVDEQGYPLGEKTEAELETLQKYYLLKDVDVVRLKKEQEIEYQKRQTEFATEDLGNGVVLEMVAIPGGKFIMGSPESEPERSGDESPQHSVTIQPFFMGKFTVTQSQWKAVADLPKVNIDLNPEPTNFKGANRPVEQVSWDDAIEFCARLSKKTEKTYRLPSEAEWEYACRAGTTTPFYFGETITTDLANYDGNYTYGSAPKGEYRQQTTDVGKFPANPFGLFDMHGNIWEWCQDEWHENYKGAPKDGSAWLVDNQNRLLRGGSWGSSPRNCRSACRRYDARGSRINFVGFRVVLVRGRT